jgi:outer membrane protein TolC
MKMMLKKNWKNSLLLTCLILGSHSALAIDNITLEEFVAKYLENSYSVDLKKLTNEAGAEKLKQAKSVYYPEADAIISTSKTDKLSGTVSTSTDTNLVTKSYLKITENLFNGLKDRETIEYNKKLLSKYNFDLKTTELSEVLSAVEIYFNYFKAQRDLENIKKEIDFNNKSLVEMRKKMMAGNASRTQVISLQSTIATNEVDLAEAIATLKTIVISATKYVGINLEDKKVDYPVFKYKIEDVANIQSLLKTEDRPEILAQKENSSALLHEAQAIKAVRLPTLDLSGSYYLSDNSKYSSTKDYYSVGLTLTIPFPFGDSKSSQINQALIDYNSSLVTEKQKLQDLDKEKDVLIATIVSTSNQMIALKNAVSISEENVRLLKKDYQMGLSSYSDYLTATTSYQQMVRKFDKMAIDFEYLCHKAMLWNGKNNLSKSN